MSLSLFRRIQFVKKNSVRLIPLQRKSVEVDLEETEMKTAASVEETDVSVEDTTEQKPEEAEKIDYDSKVTNAWLIPLQRKSVEVDLEETELKTAASVEDKTEQKTEEAEKNDYDSKVTNAWLIPFQRKSVEVDLDETELKIAASVVETDASLEDKTEQNTEEAEKLDYDSKVTNAWYEYNLVQKRIYPILYPKVPTVTTVVKNFICIHCVLKHMKGKNISKVCDLSPFPEKLKGDVSFKTAQGLSTHINKCHPELKRKPKRRCSCGNYLPNAVNCHICFDPVKKEHFYCCEDKSHCACAGKVLH